MKNTMFANTAGAMRRPVLFAAALAGVMMTEKLHAQPAAADFVPFKDFVNSAKSTTSDRTMAHVASGRITIRALEEARQKLVTTYDGVQVNHSFVRDGSHFDCVPIDQQPAARILGVPKAAPPPPELLAAQLGGIDDAAPGPRNPKPQIDSAFPYDRFGNSMLCEENTIPLRRVTLEGWAETEALGDELRKRAPIPDAGSMTPDPAAASDGHKYAIAFEYVNNDGGGTTLNVWSPYVNTALGELMSLSQMWILGGSGDSTQSAEVGWQVLPKAYGTEDPVLFIYFTPDNYGFRNGVFVGTKGCYNLSSFCPYFYQVSNNWILGSKLSTNPGGLDLLNYSSTFGGAQGEISLQYYFYLGNWWLIINGEPVGYYSANFYNGGALSRNAEQIQFGSESYGTNGVWPPEGSGYMPSLTYSNYTYSAYQRHLFYRDLTGTRTWAKDLRPSSPSPNCYSASTPNYTTFSTNNSMWGWYFFHGGPGGRGCL